MPFRRETRAGAHALDHNQEVLADRGYFVISGCETTTATDFSVSVSAGEVAVDGEIVDVSSQTVSFNTPDSNPYQAALYVDTNGSVNVTAGDEAPVEPSDADTVREVRLPSPPSFADDDATVISTVLVDSDAIDEDDILNRRWFGDRTVAQLQAIGLAAEDRLELPTYSSIEQAPQASSSLIEIEENGATTPPGLYWYDASAEEYQFVQGDVTVESSGNISDLNIDADKDFGGRSVTGLGSVSTNKLSIGKVAFKAILDDDVTVPSETTTELPFNVIDGTEGTFDSLGSYDTNESVFIAPEQGTYQFTFNVLWNSFTAVEDFVLGRFTGDVATNVRGYTTPNSEGIFKTSLTQIFEMESGDAVSVVVRQDTGNDEQVRGGSAVAHSSFEGVYLG